MGHGFSKLFKRKVDIGATAQLAFDDQEFDAENGSQGARMNAALVREQFKSRPGFEPAEGAFEFAQHNMASAAEEVDEATHGAVPAAAAAVFEPGHRSPPRRRAHFVTHVQYGLESEPLEEKSDGEQEPEIELSDQEDAFSLVNRLAGGYSKRAEERQRQRKEVLSREVRELVQAMNPESDEEDVPGRLRRPTIGERSPHNSRVGGTGGLV